MSAVSIKCSQGRLCIVQHQAIRLSFIKPDILKIPLLQPEHPHSFVANYMMDLVPITQVSSAAQHFSSDRSDLIALWNKQVLI